MKSFRLTTKSDISGLALRSVRLAVALASATALSGCAVIAVADTAATVVVGTVGLAADAVIGTARMVLPGDDKKDKK
jgi:uncharacterized membrane protein